MVFASFVATTLEFIKFFLESTLAFVECLPPAGEKDAGDFIVDEMKKTANGYAGKMRRRATFTHGHFAAHSSVYC